jgi:predicted alpha/beta hydrolase family esterase
LKKIWELELDYDIINKNSINKTVVLSDDDPRINLNTKNLFDKTWNIEILNGKGHFNLSEDEDLFETIFQNIPCYTNK